MERQPVDVTLLTQEQRDQLEMYQRGFGSTFWVAIQARLTELEENILREYDVATGEQHLGRCQGARKALGWVLSLPAVIENEFLNITGQLGGGSETEAPVEAGDWRS